MADKIWRLKNGKKRWKRFRAYKCKLIEKNIKGEANESIIGQYDENVVMMMYDSVVIKKEEELV